MTSTPHTDPAEPARIQIGDHGDLIAVIPALLGFVPANSTVILGTTTRASNAARLTTIARLDLTDVTDLADHLSTYRLLESADTAHIVIVANKPTSGGDRPELPDARVAAHTAPLDTRMPYAEQAAQLIRVLTRAGHQVAHAAWLPAITAGQTWRCYHHPRCGGPLPDPRSTVTAAITAIDGRVTYSNRAELARTLDPHHDADLNRRAALICALTTTGSKPTPALARQLVDTAIDRAQAGHLPTADRTFADLAMALSSPRVRDASIRHCLGPTSRAAHQLWTVLTRGTPGPYRAEPAVLLAITAYLAGDGPLASIAAEVARAAVPDHGLATLLLTALHSGLPPHQLRATVTELLRHR